MRILRRKNLAIVSILAASLGLLYLLIRLNPPATPLPAGNMPPPWPSSEYVDPTHLIGKMRDAQTLVDNPLRVVAIPIEQGTQLSPLPLIAAFGREQANPAYAWVEFDPLVFASQRDPYAGSQWHLDNIQAEYAWRVTRGAGAKIGIVDTGIDRNHPDLAGKILAERDYVNNDNLADDGHGHGTHVAGIAAAYAGNGIGGAGVCPECELYICKALSDSGSGSILNVARCITWAAGSGADVVSLSLGGPQGAQTLKDAVQYAVSHNVVVVAAAGNTGNSSPQYPGAYPQVVAVAATDRNDSPASFTTKGNWVDISAPGVNILSTFPGGRYKTMSGTSMSTPVVSGVFGLVTALYPDMSATERRRIVEAAVSPVRGNRWGMGSGVVNAYRAVMAGPSLPSPTAVPSPQPTARPSLAPRPTTTPSEDIDAQVVKLINDYRESQGLPRLPVDYRLGIAARRLSEDMDRNSFCGHFGSDGSDPFQRMRDAGYPLQTGGEIVACGYRTAENAVQGWIASPGHRAIMVSTLFTDIGCGVVNYRYTCDFGKRAGGTQPLPTPTPRRRPTPTASAPADYCLQCTDSAGLDPCAPIACP